MAFLKAFGIILGMNINKNNYIKKNLAGYFLPLRLMLGRATPLPCQGPCSLFWQHGSEADGLCFRAGHSSMSDLRLGRAKANVYILHLLHYSLLTFSSCQVGKKKKNFLVI